MGAQPVFANDRGVPQQWLQRYGHLVTGARNYSLSDHRKLEELT